jgi:ABC-2 type transport system ATP-binding protein
MSTVVTASGITKRYAHSSTPAVDDVSFSLRGNTIYGLLGRNGAGKTTLMQILTGQVVPTAGTVEVLGGQPYENEAVLREVCFVKESQRYPDGFSVDNSLHAASLLFANWDEALAQSLVDEFGLPRRRRMKKLSRGMLSAVGVIIGLASRAPLTLFDEPYLGLDAVARRMFYNRLLADYAEHPRTVVLSTHLIDEVSELVEHILVIDRGRLIIDDDVDALRGQMITATGPAAAVDKLLIDHGEVHRDRVGSRVRATLRGPLGPDGRARADDLGLEIEPVSLQDLVVRLTTANPPSADKEMSR